MIRVQIGEIPCRDRLFPADDVDVEESSKFLSKVVQAVNPFHSVRELGKRGCRLLRPKGDNVRKLGTLVWQELCRDYVNWLSQSTCNNCCMTGNCIVAAYVLGNLQQRVTTWYAGA